MLEFTIPATMLIIIAAFSNTAVKVFKEIFLDDHADISANTNPDTP